MGAEFTTRPQPKGTIDDWWVIDLSVLYRTKVLTLAEQLEKTR